MLRLMRHGAFSGFFLIILLLGGVGLVLTDWGGFFRNGVRATDVASIGNSEVIKSVTFDRTVRSILRSRNMDPQQAYQYGLINQILESMILEKLINQSAHEYGIIMGKDLLVKKLDDILSPIVEDSGLSRQEALDRILYSQSMTEKEFIKRIARDSENEIILSTLSKNSRFIPTTLAKDFYRNRKEARTFETLLLPRKNISKIEEPSEEELQSHYKLLQRQYIIPEKRSFTIATISPDQIKSTIEITEEDIKTYYEDAIDAYTIPEARTLQQAILKTEGQAKLVLQQVENGTSLKDAVIKETGDEKAYLGEDEFEKSGLLDDIAKVAFETEKGKVTGPVKTPLGWHVLFIKDIKEESVTPLEKIKTAIKEDVMRERATDEIIDLSNDIDDRLAMGEDFFTIAKDAALPVKSFKKIEQTNHDALNTIKEQEDINYVMETVFSAEEGESTPVSELSNGDFFTVYIDEVTPQTLTPFEDVKKEVKENWIDHNKKMANIIKGQAYIEALNTGEQTLAEVATKEQQKIKTYKKIGRFDEAPQGLSHGALSQLFGTAKGEYIMVSTQDGVLIGQTTNIHLPDPEQITDKELEEFLPSLSSDFQQEVISLYIRELQNKYGYQVNNALLKQMYGGEQDY